MPTSKTTIKNKTAIGFKVEVIIEPDEGGFHAYCPALKGLHTSGATHEEAMANAKDAVSAYLQSLIKHGDPIPLSGVVREQPSKYAVNCRVEALTVACTI